MHKYLRAIGFSELSDETLSEMLIKIIKAGKPYASLVSDKGDLIVEYRMPYLKGMGLTAIGCYTDDDTVKVIDYYPYVDDDAISLYAVMENERLKDRPSYLGIVEDDRLGGSLIFQIQNPIEYFSKMTDDDEEREQNVSLTALSIQGKVLLPLHENYEPELPELSVSGGIRNKNALVRGGDSNMVESITLEEMDIYATLSKRLEHEDILTIVDTNLMPYGVESDLYSIIGNIKDYEIVQNEWTKEKVYMLTVEADEIEIRIAVNKEDLLGEPRIGRRFKGIIWLQGKVLV